MPTSVEPVAAVMNVSGSTTVCVCDAPKKAIYHHFIGLPPSLTLQYGFLFPVPLLVNIACGAGSKSHIKSDVESGRETESRSR